MPEKCENVHGNYPQGDDLFYLLTKHSILVLLAYQLQINYYS